MREAARGLLSLAIEPELIVTSPYLRALQTAEIVAAALQNPKCEIVESPTVQPGAQPVELLDLLRRCESDSVLCTGHAPHLDLFIAFITGSPHPFTSLKKGATAMIQLDSLEAGAGEMVWLQPPRVLRELGRSWHPPAS